MQDSPLFRTRDLPHWDVPGAIYFITCCLQGSIPARGIQAIRSYERDLKLRNPPEGSSAEEWLRTQRKLIFARVDRWPDNEPAASYLADPALASIVFNALLHFAGERYDVFALVVMPSHFHWAFRPLEPWIETLEGSRSPRERVMKSVKSYSATGCNRARRTRGAFWQEESYDHWIRDLDELERIIGYIELNPVAAGLVEHPEDWRFSSVRLRNEQGVAVGMPLSVASREKGN